MVDNNHNEDPEALQTTEASPEVPLVKYEGLGSAYKSQGSHSPLDQLVDPGRDPLAISMRSFFDKVDEGSILACAFAQEWADCCEFQDEDGKRAMLMNMSARTSRKGYARSQLVEAYTGERRHQENRGFIDKVKGLWSGDANKEANNNG